MSELCMHSCVAVQEDLNGSEDGWFLCVCAGDKLDARCHCVDAYGICACVGDKLEARYYRVDTYDVCACV